MGLTKSMAAAMGLYLAHPLPLIKSEAPVGCWWARVQKASSRPDVCPTSRRCLLLSGRWLYQTSPTITELGLIGLLLAIGFQIPYRPSKNSVVGPNARFYRIIAPLWPYPHKDISGYGRCVIEHLEDDATPTQCGQFPGHIRYGGTGCDAHRPTRPMGSPLHHPHGR